MYDAFFKSARGMTIGCWMHARRYFFKALDPRAPHGTRVADSQGVVQWRSEPKRCRAQSKVGPCGKSIGAAMESST